MEGVWTYTTTLDLVELESTRPYLDGAVEDKDGGGERRGRSSWAF